MPSVKSIRQGKHKERKCYCRSWTQKQSCLKQRKSTIQEGHLVIAAVQQSGSPDPRKDTLSAVIEAQSLESCFTLLIASWCHPVKMQQLRLLVVLAWFQFFCTGLSFEREFFKIDVFYICFFNSFGIMRLVTMKEL